MSTVWGRDGSRPAKGTILVAEDHAPSWRLAKRLVEDCGYAATWAGNGADAVGLVERSRYELVLMDCHMPDFDGLEAARAIRLHEARLGTRRTPIVGVTADATPGSRGQCVAAGMDDFILKPLTAEVLAAVLARWLTPAGGELDHARLAELGAAFSDVELAGMLREITTDVTSHLHRIEAALASQDHPTIAHAAHQIANSASLVGAGPLSNAARHLYQVAGAGGDGNGGALDAATAAVMRRWEPTRAAIALRASA